MNRRIGVSLAIAVISVWLGVNPLAAAATLKGTVRNGTTGKPAAGDEVVLLSVGHGMREIGRGQTDAGGHFSIDAVAAPVSTLVRVVHQGVDYGRIAPSGVNRIEVEVYDAAGKLEGVVVSWKAQRFQTEDGTLQVIEEILVRNGSNPPRTLRTFEVQLPPEAEIVHAAAQTGDGQPLARKPIPGARKGQYSFPFPVRPGDSRFAIAYRLPYTSQARIESKSLYPVQQFAVVLPKSMKFAAAPGMFQPMPDETRGNVQVAEAVKAGQPLAFRVAGTGKLVELGKRGQESPQAPGRASGREAPAPRPDPPQKLGWYYLGWIGVVLAAIVAGFLADKRRRRGERAAVPKPRGHGMQPQMEEGQ